MSHVATSAMMLEQGYIDCAMIAYGSNQRSGGGKLATPFKSNAWEAPYRPLFPVSSYALAAARHFHEFGTTREHLAEVAVAARGWANTNPEAFAKGPLSIDDCLSARMISSPLGVRDCCLVTDGAAAIVMTRADRARDLARPPVPVLGAAAATWYSAISQADDLTTTAAAESGPRAYEMAGIAPHEVDVIQLYDAFTINPILFLEDLGFCPKGEGGRFVSGGRIGPGGDRPVNTDGGGLSCAHPGMYGLLAIVEVARQLRGEAANQVARAEIGLAHAHPVMAGVPARFELVDEPYRHELFEADIEPLLWRGPVDGRFLSATHAVRRLPDPGEEPQAPDPAIIVWATSAGNSPVVTLQPGDRAETFAHPAYRTLVRNALRWVASPSARAWAAARSRTIAFDNDPPLGKRFDRPDRAPSAPAGAASWPRPISSKP